MIIPNEDCRLHRFRIEKGAVVSDFITIVGWYVDDHPASQPGVNPITFLEKGPVWCVFNYASNIYEFPDGARFITCNDANRHAKELITQKPELKPLQVTGYPEHCAVCTIPPLMRGENICDGCPNYVHPVPDFSGHGPNNGIKRED